MITHINFRAIAHEIAHALPWLSDNFLWEQKRRLKHFNQLNLPGVLGLLSQGER
jgi:hypothetical protein